ncbi:hypothetical protein BT63DRAFT_411779 [Microthyrium microscopicum]|uniref:Uncharacterized protein n=1 Tax=Microthyrium microscopicum TaxID=703497 RepID=A0A6A6UNN4_9PEZI|nr:hypothetical protein BT63DRAFT_411779 [Microthyrium microscopicum]
MGEQKFQAAASNASRVNINNLLNDLTLSSNPLEDVEEDEYILLLTPYLHAPPPHMASSSEPMDPFEPFGRELSKYHANLRHVPYIARNGMQEIHEQQMDHAGGVIVVICEPPPMQGVSSSQRLDLSKHQERFAGAVGRYLKDSDTPSILLTIEHDGTKEAKRFDEVLQLDDWDELEDCADRIYDR